MAPNPLAQNGAQPQKQPRFSPLFTSRFLTGLWLQRSPLRDPSTRVESIYYGGRPEALIAGVNIELTNALTLIRRPGTTPFCTQTVSEAINSFYAFKTFTTLTENIQVMMDGLSKIYTISPAQIAMMYTKSTGAGIASLFGVNNTLYIGDGVDQRAWPAFTPNTATITATVLAGGVATYTATNTFSVNQLVTVTGTTNGGGVFNIINQQITSASGSQFTVAITSAPVGSASDSGTATIDQTRNWGIATAGVSTSSAYCGTGTSAGSGGGPANQGPNTVTLNSTTFLDQGFGSPPPTTPFINATGFNFNIPATATITGVFVTALLGNSPVPTFRGYNGLSTDSIVLLKAGVQVGTGFSGGFWAFGSLAPVNYGSSSTLWGTTLTPSDVNNASFGVAIQGIFHGNPTESTDAGADAKVASITISVYYTTPPIAVWTNPASIQGTPDGAYATAVPSGNSQTGQLFATNYGFSVTGTIIGIQVNIVGHVSAPAPTTLVYAQLQDNNGNPYGTQKALQLNSSTDTTLSFGSGSDLWGNGVIPLGVVNSTSFGVQIAVSGNGQTFSLDACQIQISSSSISATVSGSSGTFNATTGYKYVYEYSNSNAVAPVFSPATSPTTSTGAFTDKLNVGVGVVASTDPQVTSIWVFRTTDGGANFLALPTNPYPNVTTTITDNAADSSLIITQLADVTGLNTPPPIGIGGMVFHMGRLWGFVNNVLYYAVGPDLGNILGSPYEGWPRANFFTLPSKVTKLIPTSVGLLVHTVSDIYIVYGNASASAASTGVSGLTVFYISPFISGVGLQNQFAADINGTTIYMFTTDRQLLSLDQSSGISEIGFPIGVPNLAYPGDPSLQSFDPSLAHVTWHVSGSQDKAVFVADGSTGWFRCNTSQAPEGGFVWSPKANITGGCDAVFSIETSPGIHQLLIGPTSGGGLVLFRDLTVFADNQTAYPANFTMGNIVLAYPGQMAEIDFITCDFNQVGTSPIVSILLDEISGTFQNISGYVHQDPPELYGTTLAPNTLFANRYDMQQSVAGQVPKPIYCRHFQLQVDYGNTDVVRNEIFTMTVFGSYLIEK